MGRRLQGEGGGWRVVIWDNEDEDTPNVWAHSVVLPSSKTRISSPVTYSQPWGHT